MKDKIKNKELLNKKSLNYFYFKLGITKKSTQDEINSKVLKYVEKKNKTKAIFNLPLSDIQKNDAEFMLTFYRLNAELTKSHIPGDKLLSDVDFMIEYLKLQIFQLNSYMNKQDNNLMTLYHVLKFNYNEIKQNPIFWEKLSDLYNDVNILLLINDETLFDNKSKMENKKIINKIILGLSEKFLIKQAQKFGFDMVKFLPEELRKNSKIIGAGVTNDGFKSLKFLHISKVLENKQLIYKAYLRQGAKELAEYLYIVLNQQQNSCYSEDDSYVYYDAAYKQVQDELLNDKKINNILTTYLIQEEIRELEYDIMKLTLKENLNNDEQILLEQLKEKLEIKKSSINKNGKIISVNFKEKTNEKDF